MTGSRLLWWETETRIMKQIKKEMIITPPPHPNILHLHRPNWNDKPSFPMTIKKKNKNHNYFLAFYKDWNINKQTDTKLKKMNRLIIHIQCMSFLILHHYLYVQCTMFQWCWVKKWTWKMKLENVGYFAVFSCCLSLHYYFRFVSVSGLNSRQPHIA